ncbi:MAG: putative penicillin acylase [uncultured Solirubrobacteraceae bacterium]|uniref:Putative penicillin acylase n=1 Tax=uncultured Solirubrobacteraceae bacterium TaxID=1162706 RepID=A0A6J4SND0_9ACTN|nr:MAG: putative penicillin acylase [uncultured Solirubrobacteraceae bacterium]
MIKRPLIACLAAAALATSAPAAAQVQPYRTNDFGGFNDVLPPGANGHSNLVELAAFLATGRRPVHNDDQRDMYAKLLAATPGVTAANLGTLFKDASFGSPPGGQDRAYAPAPGLTITRDRAFGVPHVYGTTRAAAMFGLGYVAAEDRLFLIDALRHAGRGQLSSFAGGAAGNRAQDAEQWANAPYTEADLQRQADQLDDLYGEEGRQLQQDAADYVAGVNRYISEAKLDIAKMPGEYAAIGRPLGPDPWKVTDVIATAALVGGTFGKGGGDELTQMQLRRAFIARYGKRRGEALWREWAGYEDADAPTTITSRRRFAYQTPPSKPAPNGLAIADAGSLRRAPVEVTGAGAAASAGAGLLPRGLRRMGNSNALLVSAAESASGRPLAVFGPQVGYFSPQILMEVDVHAPTIDARGAAFAGLNLYVQLGRGRDYAWSATSAGQDIIDTFAVDLCEPGGAPPTTGSTHYMFRGRCESIEVLERTNRWSATLADATPAGTQKLRAERTKLGLVTGRATIKGAPVAYTRLRSTYMHEVDSARGFADFNNPDKMRDAEDFQRAAHKIGYTFNWLYVDDRDIAYFNSGNNPQRANGVTGQLPMPARLEWRGLDPARQTAAYTSFAKHPQAINGQPYMTSWNNKQARGYAGADTNLFSAVFRSQMLDQEIEARIAGPRKIDLPGLVEAMGEAATTDLRAEQVLPLALRVIGSPQDPRLADAVAKLRAWVADGSHRRDRDGDGRYEHADAIRILDAFWPRWLRAQFEPSLGAPLYAQLTGAHEIDNTPNDHGDHTGSAYQTGWYGYAYKDLRRVLGLKLRAPYAKRYCGGGSRARCASALRGALAEALDVDPATLYRDAQCTAAAGTSARQACFDKIAFRATGALTQPMIGWQNRPTYQLAVEVQGHRPR